MMARVVHSQLNAATRAFFERDVSLADRVIEKDDHIDNMLDFIEEKCFHGIAREGDAESVRARQLRGAFRVALDLERVGNHALTIADQAAHLARLPPRPAPFDLAGPTRVALTALNEVIRSFTEMSVERAKRACRSEVELDRQYREALAVAFDRLALAGEDPAFVITNLFVSKALERTGDAILSIGESALYILTGERLKLHQYLHLEKMLQALPKKSGAPAPVDLQQIWGGISGARVVRLALQDGGTLIWKEGAERKIEEEVRQMEEWNRIVPGLVPDVKARHRAEGRVSFLSQFLEGVVLRDLYLTYPWDDKVRATRRLLETLRDIWLATMRDGEVAINYAGQIRERLPELYAVHPKLARLRRTRVKVFGIPHRSLKELLRWLEETEPRLAPSKLVRIHGDLNTNNVIYDPADDRVHLIDVHRSGPGDYAQDIGVLLVSNVRNPVDDPAIADELTRLGGIIEEFAREFARRIGDEHFQTRLTLAKARSFITSARLVTDPVFARSLYLQGIQLLESVAGAAA